MVSKKGHALKLHTKQMWLGEVYGIISELRYCY